MAALSSIDSSSTISHGVRTGEEEHRRGYERGPLVRQTHQFLPALKKAKAKPASQLLVLGAIFFSRSFTPLTSAATHACSFRSTVFIPRRRRRRGPAVSTGSDHSRRSVRPMGCFSSKPADASTLIRRRPASIGEVAVFVPGLRVPEPLELPPPLADSLPRRLTERLAASRDRIANMAAREALAVTKPRRRAATQHGASTSADLVQALEEYLPVILGMANYGSELEDKIHFAWMNQEDDAEETALPSAWYEVLSVLHMMAMLRLSQANSLLLPKTSLEGYHAKVSEENKRDSVEIFLKAAGHLECAMQHVLPRMSAENRKGLPVDLSEGVLKATCMQALGQAIDVQLGLAIDSPKATLAVKRRLACEMVKCWQQAHESIADIPLLDGWGEKHRLFVKWKHMEAKAAAYYYHGLILDEGNTEKSHRAAVAALQSAEESLRESRAVCEAFHTASPFSRSPTLWGSMKYLHDKIHKDSNCKVRINKDLYSNVDRTHETVPALPDFVVALQPEEYRLPRTDAASAND